MFCQLIPRPTVRWAIPALIAALLGVAPAFAQDHDLVMESLTTSPSPPERGCTTHLSASFRVNGARDFEVNSGEVKIELRFAGEGTTGWTKIGELTVSFAEAEGERLRLTSIWPDHFTAEGTSLGWRVPDLEGVGLQAEVMYTDSTIRDEVSENNILERWFSTVEGDCQPGNPCIPVGSGDIWLCDPCVEHPEVCWEKIWEPAPRLCEVVGCTPCLTGLSCRGEAFEVLLSQPEKVFVTLFGNDQPVMTAKPLDRPIRVGDVSYHYRLVFKAQAGVSYRLRVGAGNQTLKKPLMELKGLLRPSR